MSKIVVLSLGGSLIIPSAGFNIEFLQGFRKLITKKIEKGYRFIIVCGGGQTARSYQAAAREIGNLQPDDIDWIGIHSTRLNAHFIRTILRAHSHPVVARDFTKKLEWTEPVLVTSGWKPGWTTDYCAVKFAELYDAKTVINLSNVSHIYDSDPRSNPKAKKLEKVSWAEVQTIVGDKHIPGANLPFDPIASKEGEKLGLKVLFAKGTDFQSVNNAIEEKEIVGTVIS